MTFSLIICTYQRPKTLLKLLESVKVQTLYPDEILVVDGSTSNVASLALEKIQLENLNYFYVKPIDRGLTRQRNFGIENVKESSDVVCFVDDDTVLQKDYFEKLIQGFKDKVDAIGFGGVASNENKWFLTSANTTYNKHDYDTLDGYAVKKSMRHRLRSYLGLASDKKPGFVPQFSHGSSYSYPLTGKIYPTELIIGMSMAFRTKVFKHIRFSMFFDGYGLYEDADFCIRALDYGNNYINTGAQCEHHHEASGRPNSYRYGKMVVRNGWHVWRVRWPKPSRKAKIKWHAITLLLIGIRVTNILSESPKAPFMESLGRFMAWCQLFVKKPQLYTESNEL